MDAERSREQIEAEREMARARNPALYAELQRILYRIDPCHLVVKETPADEYEPEARKLVLRLSGDGSARDTMQLVKDVFEEMFGPDTECNSMEQVGELVWEAWNRQRT